MKQTEDLEVAARRRDLPISDFAALKKALTHKSLVPDAPLLSNERLEFLGDAVLGLIINEYLCASFPDRREGELARAKSLIVCKSALAAAARRLDLAPLLLLGPAEEAMGGRNRSGVVADAYEAIVAVIYYESGFDATRQFILKTLKPEIDRIGLIKDWRDPKSVLQELRQGDRLSAPVYRVTAEQGMPHDKTFEISVYLDEAIVGTGVGKSKREAEQAAAESALAALLVENASV